MKSNKEQVVYLSLLVFFWFLPRIALGEDYIRHDISAVSSFRGLSPKSYVQATNFVSVVDECLGLARKGVSYKKFESTQKFVVGTYICTNLLPCAMNEWNGARFIYIELSTNGPSRLVLEDFTGQYTLAPGSENCYWNENTIFFGPEHNGLCFYYQAGFDCLYTIFSPFGLQYRMKFLRADRKFNYAEIKVATNQLVQGAVFTNCLFYSVSKGTKYGVIRNGEQVPLQLTGLSMEEMGSKSLEKIKQMQGLYERTPDEIEKEIGIRAVYLLISECGNCDVIFDIGGKYYLKNSNYVIFLDECFVNRDIYKKTCEGIEIMNVFSFNIFDSFSKQGLSYFSDAEWFQRKYFYRRVTQFEMDVIVPKFELIGNKKFYYESTMEWFYRKFRTAKKTPTYTL